MEQAIIDQLLLWATSYYGIPQGAAGLLLGLFGRRAIAWIRPWVVKTPTQADDMILTGLEKLLSANTGRLPTVEELEKLLTTPEIARLVRIRKAKIAAAKA